ncbi:hypothetical protein Natpe_1001 [Natrinema pellirubrum DSM 15624]|uniref:Glycosyltransferase 61 catalytic domain-containing protein n=1 Tax=Natrinema pellirubrum (strain DSM 15624 / CIP 106293 / JCM 10476 / NCIMB 786 / 157) TaxID=797303 RepID=L0JJA8_NATP1|nr:glycosyltransferase family 61 protein [Natrinema pellirubrum]AGB30913.1 hypothetical protein Natpe_1001 [Natrinema pellirubrum DSM 15624]
MKGIYKKHIESISKKAGVHSVVEDYYNTLLGSISDKAILTREELRNRADSVYTFSSPETVCVSSADEFSDHYTYGDSHHFKQPFIAEIRGGRVLNGSGICTTENYQPILDSDKSVKYELVWRISLRKLLVKSIKNKLNEENNRYDHNTVVPFTSTVRTENESVNYFVWVHNYITKIQGIEKYSQITGREPKILLPKNSPSWMIESLRLFGYDNDLVFWNPEDELRIRRLVIPSNRRGEKLTNNRTMDHKILSPIACEWLRKEAEKCLEIPKAEYPSKVFISRGDANRRELENRDEILNHLRDRGFVSYELTDLTFQEQVSLFSQADQVVGVHGAGLINLIFSSQCSLTEIFGDQFVPTYFLLAQSLGLGYNAILGESTREKDTPPRHQNIKLDPEQLSIIPS